MTWPMLMSPKSFTAQGSLESIVSDDNRAKGREEGEKEAWGLVFDH